MHILGKAMPLLEWHSRSRADWHDRLRQGARGPSRQGHLCFAAHEHLRHIQASTERLLPTGLLILRDKVLRSSASSFR